MKELKICNTITVCKQNELSGTDEYLINKAKEAAEKAYAPYSGFHVGAALLLDDNTMITGNNQENAAYPSGMCAERVALFTAMSQQPGQSIKTLAIAAYNSTGFTSLPVSPCGSCRQVLLEYEKRQNTPIRILLYGVENIYLVPSSASLLPLCFDHSSLEK